MAGDKVSSRYEVEKRAAVKEFAARLTATRQAYGAVTGCPDLSRGQFAELLELKEETYRRYERGENEPSILVLARIRELTGLSLDYLVAGAGDFDPATLTGECRASFIERLRWARELHYPTVEAATAALGFPVQQYARWEDGRDPMPDKAQEHFCAQFSVSMPYLQRGLPHGLPVTVLVSLHRGHSELWHLAAPTADGDAQAPAEAAESDASS